MVRNLSLQLLNVLLLLSLAQHLDLHTLLKQAERLCKVTDLKFVTGVRAVPCVLHFEGEPLLVAFGIRVDLYEQVVALDYPLFVGSAPLDVLLAEVLGFSTIEVAALKHRIEE